MKKEDKYTSDPLEELRESWRKLSADSEELDKANKMLSEQLSRKKAVTIQDELSGRLRRISRIGAVFPLLAFVMFYQLDIPLWLCVMYTVFGLVMGALNRILGDYVSAVRLVDLPVADALRRATYIKVRQQQLRALGVTTALMVVGLLMTELLSTGNDAMVLGAAAGLAGGLAIGIPRCIKNARLARRLVESLSQDGENDVGEE